MTDSANVPANVPVDEQKLPETILVPTFKFAAVGTSTQNNATGSTSTFGFGASQPVSAFGPGMSAAGTSRTDAIAFGGKCQWQSGPTTAHSSSVPMNATTQPYSAFLERDPINNKETRLTCITALPSYRSLSLEELRMKVCRKNRGISIRKWPETPALKKQERLEVLLRQFLLEDMAENIRFHLYSEKISSSDQVIKPRVICTNKIILSESSKYFSGQNMDMDLSGSPWVILADDTDVPSNARMDDYGYDSDSDLEGDDSDSLADFEELRAMGSPTIGVATPAKFNGGFSENSVGSVGSSEFIVIPEQLRMDGSFSAEKDGTTSRSSGESRVRDKVGDSISGNPANTRPQFVGGCNVLVKDIAFKTWYTLLNYLYTDKVHFLPLSSALPGGHDKSSTNFRDEPKCSAKSMYRLASKAGLDRLRGEALTHIRSQLTEHNILEELSCSLVQRHPELLQMELDVLHSLTASPSVIANFPSLAQRIANKELPHGADIIVGIHSRFLKQLYPLMNLTQAAPLPSSFGSPKLIKSPATTSRGKRKGKAKSMTTGQQVSQANLGESVPSPASPSGRIKPEDNEESPLQRASGSLSPESSKTGEISNDCL